MNSSPFVQVFLPQTPVLVVYFIGIVVALGNWSRCRTPAALTLTAMISLGLLALLRPAVMMSLFNWRTQQHWTVEQFSFINAGVGFVFGTVSAVSIGLLLLAVFQPRSSTPGNTLPPGAVPPITTL